MELPWPGGLLLSPPFPWVLRGISEGIQGHVEVLGCGRSCRGCHPPRDTVMCCGMEQISRLARIAHWIGAGSEHWESALFPAGWT